MCCINISARRTRNGVVLGIVLYEVNLFDVNYTSSLKSINVFGNVLGRDFKSL